MNFECEIFAGNDEGWESIKPLVLKKKINIYADGSRNKIVEAIVEENEKEQNLDLAFSRFLYIGNAAYLNGDEKCIRTIWKYLKMIIKQKKEENSWGSEEIICFLFKYLPERLLDSENLSLNNYIYKRGRIILIMELLYQEANTPGVDDKLGKKVFSLCSNLSKQAQHYATH